MDAVPAQSEPSAKAAWRVRISVARRRYTTAERAADAAALAHALRGVATTEHTVCGYVPIGTEPGSTALLDTLRDDGAQVLLPITGDPGPLRWGRYTGADELRRGRYGLREPAGPALPPETIGDATLILVPALAVDRRGVRLGRGAGYYDRSLPLAARTARIAAVVRDDEVLDELPEDPHDRRVGWVLTPGGGLRPLEQTHDWPRWHCRL